MRYTCSLPALLSLCVLALASVGMSASEAVDSTTPATPERTVIFAPIGLGPFAEIDKDANLRIPREMVDYVKRNKAKFEARLAGSLPGGDDEIWNKDGTARRMASGAHYAIVGTIDSIKSEKAVRGPGKRRKNTDLVATMTIRAINPAAGEVWVKTFKGKVQEKYSDNVSVALGQKKQAVQAAATKCMNALLKWLNNKYDPEKGRFLPEDGGKLPEAKELLDIKITSIPEGAKIHVDGVFRGNTPAVVPLSARKWTIKIERQGYEPWVQGVEISPEMVIQPALTPIKK